MWFVPRDDEHWNADKWGSYVDIDDIPAVDPNPPKYLFDNPNSFAIRHRNGTLAESKLEKAGIKGFNERLRVFYAWPIMILGQDGINNNWLFLVQAGADDSMLPKEGNNCMIMLPKSPINYLPENKAGKRFHGQTEFVRKEACRVNNPCSQLGVKDDYWERTMAFEVAIPSSHPVPSNQSLAQRLQKRDSPTFLDRKALNFTSRSSFECLIPQLAQSSTLWKNSWRLCRLPHRSSHQQWHI